MLVLPFPSNPTGAIMNREELEKIAEVIRETDMLVLSDEIYCELNYSSTPHVSIASLPGMRERTIVVNGFSKSYAMTGWRIGYVAAIPEMIDVMTKLHQFAVMCAPTLSQFAAIEALKNGQADIDYMRSEYDMRRRYIVDRLNSMGLDCFEPEGAFYAFPCIRSTGLTSEQFLRKIDLRQTRSRCTWKCVRRLCRRFRPHFVFIFTQTHYRSFKPNRRFSQRTKTGS